MRVIGKTGVLTIKGTRESDCQHLAMNESIAIRVAVADDASAICALWLGLMRDHERMDERWRLAEGAEERWYNDFRWLVEDDSHLFLAATAADRVIGFIHAYLWEDLPLYVNVLEVFVASVYVYPDYRLQGAGEALVEGVKSWGVQKGAERIRLGVLSVNNGSAAFWESQGAEPLSVFYTLPLEEGVQKKDHRRQIGF